MADKIYLETTELESIASNLKTKGNSINEEFTNSCYSALQMSSSSLEITGLDTTSFFESFKTIYSNISIRCGNLSSFITETIIPSYDAITKAITDNFNSELNTKISSIIGITAGTASGIAVTESPAASQGAQTPAEDSKETSTEPTEEPQEKKVVGEQVENNKIESEDSKQEVINSNTNIKANKEPKPIINETPKEQIVPEPIEIIEETPVEPEPIVNEIPVISETQGILEETVPLDASKVLLSGDLSGATVKKGVGIGIGIAGAAAAAGVTSYTINSNNKKDELDKDKKREKVDSKTFLERESMTI